jgi:hypothetical protein
MAAVMVVGALIFVLGIDLVKEALWDCRHRVTRFEYLTIASIMVVMTAKDFVAGVLFGIVVSCACSFSVCACGMNGLTVVDRLLLCGAEFAEEEYTGAAYGRECDVDREAAERAQGVHPRGVKADHRATAPRCAFSSIQ